MQRQIRTSFLDLETSTVMDAAMPRLYSGGFDFQANSVKKYVFLHG